MSIYMQANKLIHNIVELAAQRAKLKGIPKPDRHSKADKTDSKCEETESFRLHNKL